MATVDLKIEWIRTGNSSISASYAFVDKTKIKDDIARESTGNLVYKNSQFNDISPGMVLISALIDFGVGQPPSSMKVTINGTTKTYTAFIIKKGYAAILKPVTY